MKIGLVTAFYDERNKGNEYYLAKYLTKLGHKVVIYVSKYSLPRYGKIQKIDDKSELDNVEVVRLPCLGVKKKGMIWLFGLKRRIEKDNLDVVHVQEWFMPMGFQLRKLQDKLVLTQRIEHLPTILKPLYWLYGREMLENCKVVTALTTIARDDLVVNGVRWDIKVIPNGVDTEVFYPCSRSDGKVFKILYVGRLAKDKGVDILIKACQYFDACIDYGYTDWLLTIIGKGEEEANLKELAKELGIENHIYWLSQIPQEVLKSHYSYHIVTIVPSLSEPFGFVTMESLACGTPVIASDVGGMRDVITDKVGIKVPPNDILRLRSAVFSMMNGSKKFSSSDCVRHIKDNYDWEIIAKRYLEAYDG